MAAVKKKMPRMFVSVPWKELRELHCRLNVGNPRVKGTVSVSELVNSWSRAIGEPKGFKVRRWRYDQDTDRVVLDIDWKQPKK